MGSTIEEAVAMATDENPYLCDRDNANLFAVQRNGCTASLCLAAVQKLGHSKVARARGAPTRDGGPMDKFAPLRMGCNPVDFAGRAGLPRVDIIIFVNKFKGR
jgi:hypothetical protein